MKTYQPPTYDETMRLLGGIMDNYTWEEFRPILRSPVRLMQWIDTNIERESDEQRHPDDPVVGELATLSANAEQNAMEFWKQMNEEDRERIKMAFHEKWGTEGAAVIAAGLD